MITVMKPFHEAVCVCYCGMITVMKTFHEAVCVCYCGYVYTALKGEKRVRAFLIVHCEWQQVASSGAPFLALPQRWFKTLSYRLSLDSHLQRVDELPGPRVHHLRVVVHAVGVVCAQIVRGLKTENDHTETHTQMIPPPPRRG